MQKVKLKEHIKQIRGIAYGGNDAIDSPKENYLPVLRSNNIGEGKLNFKDLVYVPSSLIKEGQKLTKGDILITASTGSIKVIGKNGAIVENYDGSFGAFCKVVRPKKSVHPDYLKHFFQSNYYRKTIQSVINGANINNIKNEHIDDLEIPLPPLPTQQKIAEILDKADELRQYNQQLIEKYNALTQSLFLEMFGDPVKNEKGWKTDKVVNVCDKIHGGGTPSKSQPEYYVGNIPWVTPKDMKSEYILDSIDHVNLKAIESSSTKLIPSGNVLMVIRSGILKHTLPVAINSVDVTINQDMKAYIPNPKLTNSVFLKNFFQCCSKYLLGKVRAVTADNIEFNQIKELLFPLVPIYLQNQFAERVQLIETQKQQAQEALDKSEDLFQSLLQRAFKGELN